MSLQKLISNYSAYNEWANHRMISWLGGLGKEILYKKTPSSFNSIDATLQHLLRTERFWLAFVSEQDISNFNWSVREAEVDSISKELIQVSVNMKERFCSYSETELLRTLHLNMPWANNELSRYEYMMHVINHSSYHRGQIVTMARSLGITEGIPNTDYNFFHLRPV